MDHSEKYTVNTVGGKVEIYKVQYNISDKRPVVLIPGWGESIAVVKDFAMILSKELSRAVCVPDYSSLGYKADSAIDVNKQLEIPLTEKIRAQAIDEFIKINPEIFKNGFVIIAHSEGAITASYLAYINKFSEVSPVILIAPAGFVKKTFIRLLKDFSGYFIKRLAMSIFKGKKSAIKYYVLSMLYIFFNPIQLGRDAWGISKSYILPILKELKGVGIDVYVLYQEDDILFHSEEYQRYAHLFNMECIPGSHAQMHIEPELIIGKVRKII